MTEKRERIIILWIRMWLEAKDLGMDAIFEEDCIYTESWGPQYIGLAAVKHWFHEYNTRGKVTRWEIKQFVHSEEITVAEWHFENEMLDGRIEHFDGVSLVSWSAADKIAHLKEFGCRLPHYNPYENGDTPELKNTQMWV